MFRRLLTVLTFALAGLLVCGASALAAPPYPAPPVVTVTAAPAAGAPAGTADTATALAAPPYPAPPVVTVTAAPAAGAPADTSDTATTLARTGAGFNVGATVLIAVTVLLLGVGLVLLGRHLRRSNTD